MARRVWGLVIIAFAVLALPAVASRGAGPRISVLPRPAANGAAIRMSGSGFGCRAPVRLRAWVEGISPYVPRQIGTAPPAGGRFSARWIPRGITDTLPWTIEARQNCGRGEAHVARRVVTVNGSGGSSGRIARTTLTGGVSTYTIDAATLNMIANNEGSRRNKVGRHILYNDPVGHCTVGYGHLVHEGPCNGKNPHEAAFKNGLTEQEARDLLARDAQDVADEIARDVHVPLNQGQVDALADFIFNVGPTAFRNSTLVRLLNQGRYGDIPKQLARWVHAAKNGRLVVLAGLVKRRLQEGALWNSGGPPSGGGGGGQTTYGLDVALNFRDLRVSDPNNPNGYRDLGVGSGYVVVTEPGGLQHGVGCTTDPGCESSAHYSFKAGSLVTLQAFPFRDSTFQGWTSGANGSPACPQASSDVCRLTLSAAASVTAHFGVKTFKLTIDNKNPDNGGVVNGSPGGEGISCGLDGSHVYDLCSAIERAYTPFYMTVEPKNFGSPLYQIGSLDCGQAQRYVDPASLSGWCKFGTTEGDQTISVDWAARSGT